MKLPRVSRRRLRDSVPDDLVSVDDWSRRTATLVSAVLVALAALAFAKAGDRAQKWFGAVQADYPLIHLTLTPALFVLIAALTMRYAPETRGSGIPQVIAASRVPESRAARALLSVRGAVFKVLLTVGALFGGASVGREGPTVQLAAAIMAKVHRLFRVPMTSGVVIAGGAAGVAAAFNTPLAGIAFAIEELAVAYEQRVAIMVMGAVMISGLTAQGLAGNYVYFGVLDSHLPLTSTLIAAPIAGVFGGMIGGLFARWMIALRGPGGRWTALLSRRPLITALACGIIVGLIGYATHGATSGTGYAPTKALLEGGPDAEPWFGPAKFLSGLATSVSGIPGGIFAPSLSVGAGFGDLLARFFPPEQTGMVILLGMAGYFTGVVRAPLTAVIILTETTGSSGAILPLFATALVGDWAGSLVCRERLYHTLAKGFIPRDAEDDSPADRPADENPKS